jgi:general stress protein 26
MNIFEEKVDEFIGFLSQHTIWVLATGFQNDISARSMSIINVNSKIYFQTDMQFEKIKQLQENPQAALCCGNYQVKGCAKILGATTDAANRELMTHYQRVHPASYKNYSMRESSCLVEVEPEKVQIWDYINGEPYITNLDLILQTVDIKKYE